MSIVTYYLEILGLLKDIGAFNRIYSMKKELLERTPHPRAIELFNERYHGKWDRLERRLSDANGKVSRRFDRLVDVAHAEGIPLSASARDKSAILNNLHLSGSRRDYYRRVVAREVKKDVPMPMSLYEIEEMYKKVEAKRKEREAKQS